MLRRCPSRWTFRPGGGSRYDGRDAVESSRDYDPAPGLGKIKAKLVAINFADDLINPPELGIIERLITQVKHGSFHMIPISVETRGHGTHTVAKVWKASFEHFLRSLPPLPPLH